MNKKKILQVNLFLVFLILLPIFTSLNVNASITPYPLDIKVDHIFEIQNGGVVILKQNFELTNKFEENGFLLHNFTTGFPDLYNNNLDYGYAYNENSTQNFDIIYDAGLDKIGFSGVMIKFPFTGIQN